ncbi:unnamed protein product [Lymnaea stagnalis]|uniref:Major facilitator superfamily (MFS) profile domain-containing protein n=1 Tax=Lymnaea stagnalis TaxID=6523 RepID=A0AAV2IHG3_LYMST
MCWGMQPSVSIHTIIHIGLHIYIDRDQMHFDDVISELGEFGPYQKKIYFIVCIVILMLSFETFISVFILAIPEHRCALPGLENDTYSSQGQWHDDLVNRTIPWSRENHAYSECEIFSSDIHHSANQSIVRCNRWVYNKQSFENTFVTEMNLVCDDISLRTYSNMILMAGVLVGSLTLGPLSDIIGRKKVLVIGSVLQFGCCLGTGFARSYVIFVVLRFFSSMFGIGMYLAAYVIGVELVGPGKRVFAGNVCNFFFCFGQFIMTGVAYGIRDWSHLQITLTVMGGAMLLPIFFVPESSRWLISTGRVNEASEIIRKVARGNKVNASENILSLEDVQLEGQGEKIWHMLKTPVLLIRCLILFFNWIVVVMTYYGLSLNVGNLSGDIYLNFCLSALTEVISSIFAFLLMDRLGRKALHCFSMLLGGVACICALFPVLYGDMESQWMTVALSHVGKFGSSASFVIIYIYSAELFPTVMRNSGMGLCSVTARIGAVLAPYISDIGLVISGDLSVVLPQLIFGGLSVVAGLLALKLPETALRALPDTVEEAKYFGRKRDRKNKYNVHRMRAVGDKERTASVIKAIQESPTDVCV